MIGTKVVCLVCNQPQENHPILEQERAARNKPREKAIVPGEIEYVATDHDRLARMASSYEKLEARVAKLERSLQSKAKV